MHATEGPRPGFAGALLRTLLVATALVWSQATAAQSPIPVAGPEWDTTIQQGIELLSDAESTTIELELLRERLLDLRGGALEVEAGSAARLADINARLAALGPPPAEGATEPEEFAQRRTEIAAELAEAQAPVLEAQDLHRRADALMREIDQVVRARFSAELRSRGPSPLWPRQMVEAAEAVAENVDADRQRVRRILDDPVARTQIARRLPIDLALALAGIAIAFGLRIKLVAWVESALGQATSPRSIALLVNLRNFTRLIVPAVGAGLLFAALDPLAAADPRAEPRLFVLPHFILAVIGASWLGASLFAPRLAAYRLVPLENADAARGARLSVGLGVVVGARLFIERYTAEWSLTPGAAAVLVYPLFVLGGVLLWRVSRLLRIVRKRVAQQSRGVQTDERAGPITLGALTLAERGAWAIAIASPILAGVGYLAAASFLLFGAVLTLGLLGAGVVAYDVATTTLGAVAKGPRRSDEAGGANEGLVPVLVAAVLLLLAIPLLALIWGARPAEIAGVWYTMRDGVTLGGMRISLGMVISFVVVFGVVFALSRILQSVLRNTVLPRTRMDAGGKNAVLAGIGYLGFFLAVIAAVSSTGIDLTSLAVVAGALSVGIGFGLQNIVSNFVSGIILLVERPIKEGDWIEVGGFTGYVRQISVRSTEIETFDRASVILPNSDLVAGTVLNRTHTGMSGRLQVPVAVAIESDPRQVEALLLDVAESYPLVLTDPSPRVLLLEIGPDALLFEIRCWLRDVNFSLSARSDMNFDILERLTAAGIRMQPFMRDARMPEPPREPPTEEVRSPPRDADPPPNEDAVPPHATRLQGVKKT